MAKNMLGLVPKLTPHEWNEIAFAVRNHGTPILLSGYNDFVEAAESQEIWFIDREKVISSLKHRLMFDLSIKKSKKSSIRVLLRKIECEP